MKYSKKTDLILPEYGRHVQQLVEHALTIENREERMRCAQTIITLMGNMFPYLRNYDDFKHKLWDHLAIMSRYKLDIDYPCEILSKEKMTQKPDKIPYSDVKIRYAHYGASVHRMIKKALEIQDEKEREFAVGIIANHMKKQFLTWNKESVDDEKIQADLLELSGGKLTISSENLKNSKELILRKKKSTPNGIQQNQIYRKK